MSRSASIPARPLIRSMFALAAAALSLTAQAATVVPVTTNGQWQAFTVDAQSTSDGRVTWIDTDYNPTAGNASDLSFSFTVSDHAILKIVDLYLAGDTYSYTLTRTDGSPVSSGVTSSVPAHDLGDAVLPFAGDADTAWADAADFSQLQLTLGAGSYVLTGALASSVTDGGTPLLSTAGAVSVTAVPEPSTLTLALAALASVVFMSRRRAR